MLRALTIYMMMIISDQSKYDRWMRGEIVLTTQEMQGKSLFEQKCSSCHSGSLQTDYSFRNNGLDAEFTDLGRGRITQNESDYGKFKVPSLRNVLLTYPYMHDGRFFSIRDVLDHYDSGIVHSETLDPLLSVGVPMTEDEKDDIIAFLATLTDYKLLNAHWLNK
jgi:cytochrome c peroxidase